MKFTNCYTNSLFCLPLRDILNPNGWYCSLFWKPRKNIFWAVLSRLRAYCECSINCMVKWFTCQLQPESYAEILKCVFEVLTVVLTWIGKFTNQQGFMSQEIIIQIRNSLILSKLFLRRIGFSKCLSNFLFYWRNLSNKVYVKWVLKESTNKHSK